MTQISSLNFSRRPLFGEKSFATLNSFSDLKNSSKPIFLTEENSTLLQNVTKFQEKSSSVDFSRNFHGESSTGEENERTTAQVRQSMFQ